MCSVTYPVKPVNRAQTGGATASVLTQRHLCHRTVVSFNPMKKQENTASVEKEEQEKEGRLRVRTVGLDSQDLADG